MNPIRLVTLACLVAASMGAPTTPARCAQMPVATAPSPDVVAAAAVPIAWGRSIEAARRAVRRDQVIVVDVSTDWCSWCRYMETHVYAAPEVCAFAAGNVFVRLDPKDGAEGQEFAKKQKVRAYPTIFIFAADGRLLGKQVGAFDGPTDFVGWLRDAVRR